MTARYQYNALKKLYSFMMLPSSVETYSTHYDHRSFITCSGGIAAHSKLFRRLPKYHGKSFGDNDAYVLEIVDALHKVFGEHFYSRVFTGSAGDIKQHPIGTAQYHAVCANIHRVLNEYEVANDLPLTVAAGDAAGDAAVTPITKGVNALVTLVTHMDELSDVQKRCYGITDDMIERIKDDIQLLQYYQ